MAGRKKEERKLADMLEELSPEELRALVLRLAEEDKSIEERLLLQCGDSVGREQIERLKKDAAAITAPYVRRRNIAKRDIVLYTGQLMDFLGKNVDLMLRRGMLRPAFEVTWAVFLAAGSVWSDGISDKEKELRNACFDRWMQVLGGCELAETSELLDWLLRQRLKSRFKNKLQDDLEEFLMREFRAPLLLQQKLDYFEARLKALRNDQMEIIRLVQTVRNRLSVMREMELPEFVQDSFLKEYWDLMDVRKERIKELRDQGRYEEAVEGLREAIRIDRESGYSWRAVSCQWEIADCYWEAGMKEEFKQEMASQIEAGTITDADMLMHFRSVCNGEEWVVYRARVMSGKADRSVKLAVLAAEGDYEQLLEALAKGRSFDELDRYKSQLKDELLERLRDIYVDILMENAKEARGYQELVWRLKQLENYPDGKAAASGVAALWRSAYAKRSTMMRCLSDGGF